LLFFCLFLFLLNRNYSLMPLGFFSSDHTQVPWPQHG
jgi:hypothetical protein